MKPVLGISVYPDIRPMSEIKQYFALASRYGCTRVFSSMFSVEGTKEEVLDLFRDMIESAHTYGLEVSLDVNPGCFRRMGAEYDDLSVFHEIGCDIVRMDMSFGTEKDAVLLKNPYGIKIEFNASSKSLQEIQELLDLGVDKERLLFCHNFYPQRYTGFRWDRFLAVNHELRKAGVRVGAFISSHAENTHGVWNAVNGLPTVEKLRDLPADLQMRIQLATGDVTDILIGNAYASEEEFRALEKALETKKMEPDNPMIKVMESFGTSFSIDGIPQKKLKVIFDKEASAIEKEIVLDFFPHMDFGDSSEWMWRSRGPRFIYRGKRIPERPCDGDFFQPGDIVMVNESYPNYAGEVQIVLLPMKNDGQRNRVGHLAPGEEIMLELVHDGDIVIFEEFV